MTAKVPKIDIGSDRLGMMVDERLRMKRKITSTTRTRVSRRVNWTSSTEALIDLLASRSRVICTASGRVSRKAGNSDFTRSATSRVLLPGCFWTARKIAWERSVALYIQAPSSSFSTPSMTVATWDSRTGLPARMATTISPYSAAVEIWPSAFSVTERCGPVSWPIGMLTFWASMASATCSASRSKA